MSQNDGRLLFSFVVDGHKCTIPRHVCAHLNAVLVVNPIFDKMLANVTCLLFTFSFLCRRHCSR